MKLYNLLIGGLSLMAVVHFTSCNKLDTLPTDRFTDENFWDYPENAEKMVNMAYNQLFSADRLWNDEALSDNIFEGRSNTDQRAIRNGTADPTLERFASEWSDLYGGIKTCHVYLENIDRVPGVDAALKKRRIAEVRFIRAFLYFRLVNFYGDVPFFTKDISLEESKVIPRTAKATVMAFIHQELDECMVDLPSKDGLPADDRGRITKGAASAFQARAFLYEGNWNKVVQYCENLIKKQAEFGTYALFESYPGLFAAANEYNSEVILDYAYVPQLKTWNKLYDAAPISAQARLNGYAPLQSLVDNYITLDGNTIATDPNYNSDNPYVNRDPRMAATIVFHGGQWTDFNGTVRKIFIKPGSGGTDKERLDEYQGASSNASATGYYVKKYYDVTATVKYDAGLNMIMFRYADILLMYAEAKEALGQLDAAIWDMTIKPIRKRAGFVASKALDFPGTGNLKTVVRNERRSELALEGLRYYDILRWKAGKTYLDGQVNGAKYGSNNSYIKLDIRRFDESRDYLWSVPRTQIDLNKNLLPNNQGYSN
ncbi:RagB/SusD family nutrient uptake outer membrane protein [Sphingobacterium sp. CZ-UAM]|uniref:RagB/SusD family nutrient uptake outer membrane protein n=1 Tax=Sphingobacterium sp. CZ-UAM TaxID=1933868 RepID=UPI000987623F|nr:RagB/SusD family nutrient uptake outer membrane protein [Sphingobacterium sp. CZ-UAM]OOG16119.1 RagB/SusD family nutrient uptake outer membrane protein [Sphingobacterium sp. CZ-UAM]